MGQVDVGEARESINMSNWHFVRNCQSIELLIYVVLDFLKILDKKVFRNSEQIRILSNRIKQ